MNTVPYHVAIVMDGNGRWATQRGLPRVAGHKKGVDALRDCVRHCGQSGVKVLSVFAFSSENWGRPATEVGALMELLALALAREVPTLRRDGVRLHFVGDRRRLSETIVQGICDAEQQTADNDALILNVCFNYGGRWDIVQAALNARVAAGPHDLSEQQFARQLALAHVPDPDLFIRTGGERRISNFLLWQAAYAELYFCDTLWPDFDNAALDAAFADYALRQRRFGLVLDTREESQQRVA